MTSLVTDKNISEILVKKGLVDERTLRDCMRIANSTEKSLEAVLVENNHISMQQLIDVKNYLLLDKNIKLPGIELKKKLGEGGMGAVYKASQTSLNRIVAIKILDADLGKDINFAKRFLLEARILARLNHPNIVKAIDFKETQGIFYYIMEYIPGKTLKDVVAKEGPLPLDAAVTILMQMTEAIQYANQKGLVHRDIKPDNIIVHDNNKAKLCDLGLAKWKSARLSLTSKGTIIGTPHYLSPEQAQGEIDVDVRSDIYSLGATFFFMLTGKPPYEGDRDTVVHFRHIYDPPPKITNVNKELPIWLDKFFAAIMAKDITKRISSPDELAKILQKYTKYSISKRGKTIAIRVPPQVVKKSESPPKLNIEDTPTPVPENTKIATKRHTARTRKKRIVRSSQPVVKQAVVKEKQEAPKKSRKLLWFFIFLIIVIVAAVSAVVLSGNSQLVLDKIKQIIANYSS